MTEPAKTKTPAKRPRRMAREPEGDINLAHELTKGSGPVEPAKLAEPAARAVKPQTKTDLILGLLRRAEGATLDQLVAATGWLPHTTRAALTGIKRKGHVLSSEKVDGVRTYRVTSSGAAA